LPSRCAFSSAWLALHPCSSSAQLLLLVPSAVLVVYLRVLALMLITAQCLVWNAMMQFGGKKPHRREKVNRCVFNFSFLMADPVMTRWDIRMELF
jgi:hypothetical protein